MTSEFFRAQAAKCTEAAEAALLPNVRARQISARKVWLDMAEDAERMEARRAEIARAHAARNAQSKPEP